jgi:hypothetical protein
LGAQVSQHFTKHTIDFQKLNFQKFSSNMII